jgi:hypothetical protein
VKAYLYHIWAHYSILRDLESEAYAPPRESAAIQMGLYRGGKVARIQWVLSIQPNLDAVGYLRGHSPPISMGQVDAVFARYDLESIGKKGGSSQS